MKLNFSKEQLQQNKNNLFPQQKNFYIKNIILKNSGEDTIADLFIQIKDNFSSPIIFGNKFSKKYLKLKIFEILDEQMLAELNKNSLKQNINNILQKYRAAYIDIYPSNDFTGNKSSILDHEEEDGDITLNYRKKIKFSRTDIDFISLGMYFYLDKKELLSNKEINHLLILDENLFSDLTITPLISDDSKTSNQTYIQDLRVTKELFKENDFLTKLNESLEKNIKNIREGSPATTIIKDDKYFSNIYFAKDTYGNANFIFSLDYKKLIKNNSQYKKILQNTAYPEDISDKSYITSFKIVKKRIRRNEKSKKFFTNQTDPVEELLKTSTNFVTKKISKIDNQFSFIDEITLDPNYRTFHVSDKKVLGNKNGYENNLYYKYGLRLTILDSYSEYLKNLKTKLEHNFVFLKKYFNETNNLVGLNKNKNTIDLKKGYYNSLTESFNSYFINYIFPLYHQNNLNKLLTDMMGILDVFGIFNNDYKVHTSKLIKMSLYSSKRVEKENLLSSLTGLLNPNFSSADTISYFMKIYEKLILYFERLIKSNYNTTYEVEYWFKNDYLNISDSRSTGYDFFNISKNAGMTVMGESFFNQIIKKNKNLFYGFSSNLDNNDYKSICPSIIKIGNKNFFLIDYYNRYLSKDYSRVEIDIKRYIHSGIIDDENLELNLFSKKFSAEENRYITNCRKLLSSNSVIIEDINNIPQITRNIYRYGSPNIYEKDAVDPSILLNQLSKFIDNEKNLFINDKLSKKEILNKLSNKDESIPYQINLLNEGNDSIFKNNKKYVKDIEENSKFLLYYNTIHNIEICTIDPNNLKLETWLPFNKNTFLSLQYNKNYLCRLVSYQNSYIGINDFNKIKLPIYDKYFILNKSIFNTFKFLDTANSYIPSIKKVIPVRKPFVYKKPRIPFLTNIERFRTVKTHKISPIFKKPEIINNNININFHLFHKPVTNLVSPFRPNRDFAPVTHFDFKPNIVKYTKPMIIPATVNKIPPFVAKTSTYTVPAVISNSFNRFMGKFRI